MLSVRDEAGWPHTALVSPGEVVAESRSAIRLALWPDGLTSRSLSSDGRALLIVVEGGAAWDIRLECRRVAHLELSFGTRSAFRCRVVDVTEDRVDYATLVGGVTYVVDHPEEVLARWRETIAALHPPDRS